ncbi:MAG: protein kinase [Deltaproteobacteria bacterium]|nr:protein kinase [Deltaproteobacteria bacterium]
MQPQGPDRSKKHSQDKVLRAFLEQMTDTATPGARPKSGAPPDYAAPRTPTDGNARPGGAAAMAETQIRPSSPPGTIPTPPFIGRAPAKGPAVILTPAPGPPTAMDTNLTGTMLADKYRLVRLLGRGGVGEVYEAVHELIGLRLAVKLIRFEYAGNSELAARFLQEARAAASVGHPGIVQVQDVGTSHDGRTYLVMEYLEGEDLEKLMRRQRRMPVGDIAAILGDVLEALDAAHAKGIVHRDLKPENVYLVKNRKGERTVKVLDFGIARLTADTGQSVRLTQPGAVMGTPYYMSPEQARGAENVDAGVDIYAAGVILFEALTGRLPFVGSTFHQVLAQSLTADFPSARALREDLPAELEQVIYKATARERADRYATAVDFAAALAPFRPHRVMVTLVDGEPAEEADHRSMTGQTPLPIPAHTSAPPPPHRATTGKRSLQPRTTPGSGARASGTRASDRPAPAPAAARPRRTAVWITLGILVLALVAGGLVLGLRRTPASTAPHATATGDSLTRPVRIRLEGVPAGADIRCDGRAVGPEFELRDGPVERTIEILVPDRPPIRRVIRATEDLTLDLGAEFPATAPSAP